MINQIFLYLGSIIPIFWGVAHLFPTQSVVRGFGDISLDNKRVITMEWMIEGVSLIFLGAIVAAATYIDHTTNISSAIYWLSFAMLNTLSLISLFTGSKINLLPFKLCPVIFTSSSVLILLGNYV